MCLQTKLYVKIISILQSRGKLFVLLCANDDSEHAAEFALIALLIDNLMVALML